MKVWTNIHNLFANGKFDYIHFNGEVESVTRDFHLIQWLKTENPDKLKELILIARPISDLSDDEVNKIVDFDFPMEVKRKYLMGGVIADVEFDLLNVGVWPFNQENPKNIKWKYENTI